MSVVALRAALEVALKAVTPSFVTAWENAPFTQPAATVPWQQVNLLLADPDNPESGAGWRELGYMQVTLKYPLQAGPSAAEARANTLRAAFAKNTSFTNGSVIVTVDKTPTIGNGTVDGARWSVPVKIPFHANLF